MINEGTGGNPENEMIGLTIKRERENAGLTQAELALRVGRHRSAVCRIESGENSPTFTLAEQLLMGCGASISIIGKDADPDSAENEQ